MVGGRPHVTEVEAHPAEVALQDLVAIVAALHGGRETEAPLVGLVKCQRVRLGAVAVAFVGHDEASRPGQCRASHRRLDRRDHDVPRPIRAKPCPDPHLRQEFGDGRDPLPHQRERRHDHHGLTAKPVGILDGSDPNTRLPRPGHRLDDAAPVGIVPGDQRVALPVVQRDSADRPWRRVQVGGPLSSQLGQPEFRLDDLGLEPFQVRGTLLDQRHRPP